MKNMKNIIIVALSVLILSLVGIIIYITQTNNNEMVYVGNQEKIQELEKEIQKLQKESKMVGKEEKVEEIKNIEINNIDKETYSLKVVEKGCPPGGSFADCGKTAKVVVYDSKGLEVFSLVGKDASIGILGIHGIDEKNEYFYQCRESGMFGGEIKVYNLSAGNLTFSDNGNIIDECMYDTVKNTLNYIKADDVDLISGGFVNSEKVIYSFDLGKLIK